MPKQNKIIKSLAFIFTTVALSLGLGYAVLAWTEPGNTPPNCTAGQPGCDAPLNVSSVNQSKSGFLRLGGSSAPTDTLMLGQAGSPLGILRTTGAAIINEGNGVGYSANGLLIPNGNVGIGTNNPNAKFEVRGVDDINVDWATNAQSGLSGSIRVVNENSMINLISSNDSFTSSTVGLSEVDNTSGAYKNVWALWRETTNAGMGGDGDFHISYDDTDPDSWWHSVGINMFTIKTNGNVGIGTTSPTGKLTVVNNNNEDSQWYSFNNTSAYDFDFIVNRARGTSAAPLPVDSTNNLGSLRFQGLESVGGNFLQAALIEASVDGTPGVGDMPAKLQFYTRTDGVGGVLTERMTIKNNGNVGIGTVNPNEPLHVARSAGAAAVKLESLAGNTSAADIHLKNPVQEFSIGTQGTGDLNVPNSFFIHDTTVGGVGGYRFVIKPTTGNVGIGTTNPMGDLHILGRNEAGQGAELRVQSQTDISSDIHLMNPASQYKIGIKGTGAVGANNLFIDYQTLPAGADNRRLTIDVSGNVGIGTTNPQGALDVSSTTGALIVPRMTTVQRDALTAVNGMIIYNTTTNQFNFRENGAWVLK